MGIIIEKLTNTVPQIQESITSAYENVAAGIAENVKSSGISVLDNRFEIFSNSNLIADFNSFQTVSEAAAYPDPGFSSQDVSKVFKDRNFNTQRELHTLFPPGWDKIGDWVNQLLYPRNMDQSIGEHSIDGKLSDGAARKQAKGPVSDVVPDPPITVPPSPIPPPQQIFLQTIAQTAEQLQTNPQQDTLQLFQQQFAAVQEMSSAVKESLQLYQQLNSNSLSRR
jgi:hypothetical protein